MTDKKAKVVNAGGQQIKMASLKISQAIDFILVTPTGIEPVFLA
jgi:hypothetical protein